MKRFILPLIMVLIIVLEVIYLPIYTESKRQNLSQATTTVITSNTLSLTAAAASAPKKKTTTKKKVTTKKKKKEKYPEARKIWNYLKKMGLNNYVAAGIMGNIMAEVGG
jgi:guanyl-specific ribonuclease Sa